MDFLGKSPQKELFGKKFAKTGAVLICLFGLYECLVIDNNTKSNKIEGQMFWYREVLNLRTPRYLY